MKDYKKQDFSCQRGDLTIRGYVLIPDKECEIFPAVIVSHGFSTNTDSTKSYAEAFVRLGYVSLYFDFCCTGLGRSDGDSRDMTVLTEAEDLMAVIEQVKKLPFVDENEILLAGNSQGGLVSAIVAARKPDEIKKLLLYYPAFSIPDDARRGNIIGTEIDSQNVPAEFWALNVLLGEKYVRVSQKMNINDVYAYQHPVLICHGTSDRIVDISYAREAAKKYPCATLVEIEGGDHGFHKVGFDEAMNVTADFLERNA